MISLLLCRDCKHYEPDMYKHFTCDLLTHWVEPNGFCAWGERKEKECNDLEHDSNEKIEQVGR